MFAVKCPECQTPVEIPANAVGPDRIDPWNVVTCDFCDLVFDYDDDEVLTLPGVTVEPCETVLPPESSDERTP